MFQAVDDMQKDAIWNDAINLWLSRQKSKNTAKAYRESLSSLLRYASKKPWEIKTRDVSKWLADQQQRGCAQRTIAARLAGAKSFYDFVIVEYVYSEIGGEEEEHRLREDNPVAAFKSPKIDPYSAAVCWDAEQAGAFLKAISTENMAGKRDKALFTGYLLMGLRNSELRLLRYENIERPSANLIEIVYNGKGKPHQRKELLPPVYEAIMAFAAAENKYEGFVFHRYDSLGRIVDLPISDQTVRNSLKYYARKAGLRTEGLRVHSLRHTAAFLRHEAGDDLESIREFLKHSNVATTKIYLQKIKPKPDKAWMTVAEMLEII